MHRTKCNSANFGLSNCLSVLVHAILEQEFQHTQVRSFDALRTSMMLWWWHLRINEERRNRPIANWRIDPISEKSRLCMFGVDWCIAITLWRTMGDARAALPTIGGSALVTVESIMWDDKKEKWMRFEGTVEKKSWEYSFVWNNQSDETKVKMKNSWRIQLLSKLIYNIWQIVQHVG